MWWFLLGLWAGQKSEPMTDEQIKSMGAGCSVIFVAIALSFILYKLFSPALACNTDGSAPSLMNCAADLVAGVGQYVGFVGGVVIVIAIAGFVINIATRTFGGKQ